MFNNHTTLADIQALDAGIGGPVINEVAAQFDELGTFPADTIEGTSIQLTVIDKLPKVRFRKANQGVPRRAPEFGTKTLSTAFLEDQIDIDKAVLRSSRDIVRVLENRSKPHVISAMGHMARQIWYGQKYNDPEGFVGLLEQYAANGDHEIDLGQDTNLSSVWFLCLAPENLQLAFGRDQTLYQSDWRENICYDKDGNPYDGLTSSLTCRVGLKLENIHAAMRIKNIGEQKIVGTGLNKYYEGGLSDDPMFKLLQKFAEVCHVKPNAIFMSPRSLEQLRASRIPVNSSGDPVSELTYWTNIPLFSTINLVNCEEVLLEYDEKRNEKKNNSDREATGKESTPKEGVQFKKELKDA